MGTSAKRTSYCNLHTSAANASQLLAVSSPDTSSSLIQRFRSKCANFVTKPRFSEVPMNFRRIIFGYLVQLLFLFVLWPFQSIFAGSFSDVLETNIHYEAIEYLAQRGIIQGYSDGTFQMEREVNRAEFLKMVFGAKDWLLKETESPLSETFSSSFSDIDTSAWYFPYVQRGVNEGIIKGYEDLNFRPGQSVNLAEGLKIMLLAFDADLETMGENSFQDVPPDAWFALYSEYAHSRNLVEASDDGLLHPEQTLSRFAVSELIYRFLYIEENRLEKFDITLNWPQYSRKSLNLEIRYPSHWNIVEESSRTIFWKPASGQSTFERIFPNSAVLSIHLDANSENLDSEAYFSDLKQRFSLFNPQMTSFLWDNLYPTTRIVMQTDLFLMNDWYVFLPNNSVLIFYATIGKGLASAQLEKEIIALEHSYSYIVNDENELARLADVLEQARSNIFVDAKGNETLALFFDAELIETDALGIGTGPVDYFYSQWANVTLKYERSFDVILGIQDGKTTAF